MAPMWWFDSGPARLANSVDGRVDQAMITTMPQDPRLP
tara:strand:+ start:1179 stop:1292 length:114 start_codon:yes stop_codon:yes gene_type:complete